MKHCCLKGKQMKTLFAAHAFRLLCPFFLALMFATPAMSAEDILPEAHPPPETRALAIQEKVSEAEKRCGAVSMKEFVETEGDRVSARPIALCAFKESDQSWHMIRIALMYPIPDAFKLCSANAPTVASRRDCSLPYRVLTQGYHVEHLGGYGITRLTFNVSQGGEHLVVYRTRHVWFDDDALQSRDTVRIIATLREINYTPYHPDFEDPKLTQIGFDFLRGRIREAETLLRANRVYSRAFPDQLVADTVPWEIPMALAAIEQTDDKKFHENNTASIENVFAEFALNGDAAFRWSYSSKDALGALQFTNANGNGTYRMVVERYPDAQLDPNFESGARDLTNVIAAAICLIDLELVQFPKVHSLYVRSPKLGGIYPVAAYNGGHGSAAKLYEWIRKRDIDVEDADITLPSMLTSTRIKPCPCPVQKVKGKSGRTIRKVVRIVEKRQNAETPGYVKKYIFVINYLGELGLDKE
jgi:hypothetical protein